MCCKDDISSGPKDGRLVKQQVEKERMVLEKHSRRFYTLRIKLYSAKLKPGIPLQLKQHASSETCQEVLEGRLLPIHSGPAALAV